MNPWNTYRSRINAHGITKRDSVLQRERAFLSAKLPASLSYRYHTGEYFGADWRQAQC